jgi:hypothetical protein
MRAIPVFPIAMMTALVLLAGCEDAADPQPAAPDATVADVASAVAAAADASSATHPLCALAQYEEIQAVVGGNISKVDVIDDPMAQSLDCVYLDPSDPYNGLSLRFTTTERLTRTGSQWADAGAYVAEWGRTGMPVRGLGDTAAWIELPPGLLVQRGDYALHLSASRADLSQSDVRAKFETLAQQVIARAP